MAVYLGQVCRADNSLTCCSSSGNYSTPAVHRTSASNKALARQPCCENIFAARRFHLYQRLVIAGWRHRTVTLLYLGLALLGTGLALAWLFKLPGSALAAALLPSLCALLLWWGVGRVERRTAAA